MQPLIHEIEYHDPHLYFKKIKTIDSIFLDSADNAMGIRETNRYSYIAYASFDSLKIENFSSTNPFADLKKKMRSFSLTPLANIPPFQGGVAGFFSYDLCCYAENIPKKVNDFSFPDLEVNFYDVVISFDHLAKKAWIVSTGLPEQDISLRQKRAQKRLTDVIHEIHLQESSDAINTTAVIHHEQIKANFSAEEYQTAVKKMKDYIKAVDIFEANLSQRFEAFLSADLKPYDLYARLRHVNPAPFAAYLHFGETIMASSSPERFLRLQSNQVQTRPIKGTRPRSLCSEQDKINRENLLNSAKDRAENIMIVDLMRNDLSKVCQDDNIVVTKLCGVESFCSVHHLVSVIEAQLKEGMHATDLLAAAFPGGSVTGAPKIRAMQIIAELEKNNRGPYCGSIGYIGFDGCMDTSIVIRSFLIKNNKVTYQVGGAIVYDSNPIDEYQETLDKAKLLTTALLEPIIF